MDDRKQAIVAALDKFVLQRSGMDYRNYGDAKSYRAEQRSITKDLHHYRALERFVLSHGISADDLLAATNAYSGRLTLRDISARYDDGSIYWVFGVEYCTGQYFPTEYRRAACAVLAAAIWSYWRERCAPFVPPLCTDQAVWSPDENKHGRKVLVSPGTWLRSTAVREFGRAIASRWFN